MASVYFSNRIIQPFSRATGIERGREEIFWHVCNILNLFVTESYVWCISPLGTCRLCLFLYCWILYRCYRWLLLDNVVRALDGIHPVSPIWPCYTAPRLWFHSADGTHSSTYWHGRGQGRNVQGPTIQGSASQRHTTQGHTPQRHTSQGHTSTSRNTLPRDTLPRDALSMNILPSHTIQGHTAVTDEK